MPSTYTTNLGIELPADGELDGVWGDVVNENMDILDRAINGSIALSLSGTTSTLTTSDGALSDGQYKLLVLGGTPSGTHTITIAPNDAQKIYFVRNTTAQSVVFTQGSGGNVTVATGDSAIIYSDGAGAGAAVVNITNDFAMSSVKITGGTIDGTVIGGTSAAAVTGTTITGTSFVSSGDMTFGDSDKAIFGAGSDLQIYHDGTNSYIKENNGTGHLVVNATNLYLRNSANSSDYLSAVDGGAVTLKYNGISTIATTATGVAVTGDVGATTGTFSGDLTIADKIVHSGDTNTAIRFPAADTVTVETSGAERLRVTSAGAVGIGTTAPSNLLAVAGATPIVEINATSGSPELQFSDGGVDEFSIQYDTGTKGLKFIEGGVGTHVIIRDGGNVGVGITNPAYKLVVSAAGASGIEFGPAYSGTANLIQHYSRSGGVYVDAVNDAAQHRFNTSGTERMRITSAGNVGIGTTAPAELIHIAGGASAAYLKATNSAGTQGIEVGVSATGDGVVNVQDAKALRLFTTDTERMRIDSSGNVGIGTASPSAKLDVRTGTTGNIAAFYGTSTYHLAIEEVGGVMFLDANNGSATIGFKTNDTERMRLDSSGNLGLGVTPSAWATLVPAIQLGGGGSFIAAQGSGTVNSDSIYIGTNAHFNGTNWLYKETNHASYSLQANGQHRFFTAPSGTAGNAITFTQAMTLDASGNLGIGTTSPDFPLDVSSTGVGSTIVSRFYVTDNTVGLLRVGNSTTGDGATAPAFGANATSAVIHTNNTERMRIDSSGKVGIGINSPTYQLDVSSTDTTLARFQHSDGNVAEIEIVGTLGATTIAERAGATAFDRDGTERMRIDASGNVGIGTSSPASLFDIRGSSSGQNVLQLSNSAGTSDGGAENQIRVTCNGNTNWGNLDVQAYTTIFTTNGTERARIDASGNLLVGTTGTPSGAANGVMLSASGQGIFSKSAAASLLLYRPDSNGNIAEFYKGSTNVGSISVTGTATAYNTSSDYRLKEDVQPMVGASDRVLSLNPVNFAWKADGSRTDGFIAHEVQVVAPQAVTGVKDGEQMQGMDHSKLVPLLTAALQEALTKIEALEARITALEA